LDKIAVREPMLPNGNPADETEEYAAWETASHKAQDVQRPNGFRSMVERIRSDARAAFAAAA
jgi:hypothetical protein